MTHPTPITVTHRPALSLYIHLPWCIQKCPYCDFNSHGLRDSTLTTDIQAAYVQRLLEDLRADIADFQLNKPVISSIFLGGGTPSLFQARWIAALLEGIDTQCQLSPHIEITLEANPGTCDQREFNGYATAGINRLSLGVQSFNDAHLRTLGRIHNGTQAQHAVHTAQRAGITNINIDLMYALPQQSTTQALSDLAIACSLNPTHLSWYQLTLEPHTAFYHTPPPGLPPEPTLLAMEQAGQAALSKAGYTRYEISAYAADPQTVCQHNQHYWEFGDYLGIGAGAHGKLTLPCSHTAAPITSGHGIRTHKHKHPKKYMHAPQPRHTATPITDVLQEYLMNRFRLFTPIEETVLKQHTGKDFLALSAPLTQAEQAGLIHFSQTHAQQVLHITPKGYQFLNTLLGYFF